jgi:hypothetical protein
VKLYLDDKMPDSMFVNAPKLRQLEDDLVERLEEQGIDYIVGVERRPTFGSDGIIKTWMTVKYLEVSDRGHAMIAKMILSNS